MTVHTMSDAERIAYLEAQLSTYKAAAQARLRVKVSEKGAISVYGMGRFPITHYASQWEKLAEFMPQILQCISDNSATVSRK